jgi:DNA-binding transcriptional MerR regulator
MVRAVLHRRQTSVTDDLQTIGETCAAFGVTPRTLRFYEAKELIAPIRTGQKRLYTRRCRARLTLILQGKRFGFSLEEIRQLLALYDIGDQQATQLAATYALGRERLRAMQAQRAELDTAIADLARQLAWAEQMLGRQAVAD